MKDPYLLQISSLLTTGLICTGFAIPGYLQGTESAQLGRVTLNYPAPVRKLPLALLGAGLCISAWWSNQDRKEYRIQYRQWQQQQRQIQQQQHAIAAQANLAAYQQVAQLQAAEHYYPQMAPYLNIEANIEATELPAQPTPTYPTPNPHTPTPTPQFISTEPAPIAAAAPSEISYLQNFLEYPSLIFGGMGAGKSWTVRYIASLKVKAGHQVILLDPHAANHEWKGICHIGAGMDYAAIGEFLEWYLAEIKRRYQAFNHSGLSEESWQESLRQQGQVISVLCEEMTNYADRLPGNIAGEFVKASMSDSRKVLMPPLFVAHDRTLTCLGDAKGLAKLRDASLLELELIPTIHPSTHKPVSSGKGKLKLPGYPQWLDVALPKIERKITDFTGQQPEKSFQFNSKLETQNSKPIPPDIRQHLEFCLNSTPEFTQKDAPASLSEPASKLLNYLQKKEDWLTTREIKKNWGQNNGQSSAQVDRLLSELLDLGVVETATRQPPDQSLWRATQQPGTA